MRGGNRSGDEDYESDEVPEEEPQGLPNSPGPPNPPEPPGPTPPEDRRRKRRRPEIGTIKLKDSKGFEGKPRDGFEAWWVMVQTYIHDQPEKFQDKGRTINWIGGLLTHYAQSWHIQWERQALAGLHIRLILC